jgi:hypothetical protein
MQGAAPLRMKITNGYEDGPRTACLLPRQQAFRAATAGAGSHSIRARLLSYQSFSDLHLKSHRIMSWQSARYARGSDILRKGYNHPKWDTLGGFSREPLMCLTEIIEAGSRDLTNTNAYLRFAIYNEGTRKVRSAPGKLLFVSRLSTGRSIDCLQPARPTSFRSAKHECLSRINLHFECEFH